MKLVWIEVIHRLKYRLKISLHRAFKNEGYIETKITKVYPNNTVLKMYIKELYDD